MISRRVEAAIPPAGSFLDVDGARVHYVESGAGAPIVLIHGLGGVLQNFTHSLTDRLAEHARVIALDRPGAGYSRATRNAIATPSGHAAVVARVIEALGLDLPLVVGHSLGGAVALALAIEHPNLARALALIAPLTQPERHAPRAFRSLEVESPLLRAIVAHTIAVPLAMMYGREAVRAIFAPERVPSDFATRGGGLLGLRPSQYQAASRDMVAARDEVPQLVRRYGEIQIPVNVLMGKQDAILDYRVHAQRLLDQIPHADVALVEGGHMLPVTQPDLVARWLLSA